MAKSPLLTPVRAIHLREALREARADRDGFGPTEQAWLARNNPVFGDSVNETSKRLQATAGPEAAYAATLGSYLGHRAVRLCVGPHRYREALRIYGANVIQESTRIQLHGPRPATETWDTAEMIQGIFEDSELTGAFLDIASDQSRHNAARTVAYFCLQDISAVGWDESV